MKIKILLVFSILTFSFSVTGQIDMYKYQFKNPKTDSTLSNSLFDNSLDNDLNINKKMDSFGKNQRNPNCDFIQKHFFPDALKIRHNHNSLLAEEYPGSSIFYAKRPYLISSPYEKSFLIKPDTAEKYHLIIKDPLPFQNQ